jgi:hypothetical protein
MILPVVFHPAVEPEVADIYHWYEQRRPGLGDAFLASLERTVNRLHTTLDCQPVVHGDVRRALILRFPYGVFYRIRECRVEVVAVQQSLLSPAVWHAAK